MPGIIIALMIAMLTMPFASYATAIENNETNVAIYVNHLSSCSLNHGTRNMLCINQEFNSVIQYHDVKQVAMCPYHYCVLFRGSMEYSCTGYVLTLLGGTMQRHLNPLTPNQSLTEFPKDDHVSIGQSFQGYNILIDYFEQSVNNHVNQSVRSVACLDPYSTQVTYEDGTVDVFGAHGIVFRDYVESLLIGVGIHSGIAAVLYSGFLTACKSNVITNLCVVPGATFLACYLILFVAEEFVVRIFAFILSSVVGVAIGYILASIVSQRRRPATNKVGVQDESERFVEMEQVREVDLQRGEASI